MGLLDDAVARLRRRGASFADARHVRDERETLAVRDGRVERHFRATSSGFGVRVLTDGAWGFGARAGERDDAAALEAAAEAALATARAAASLGGSRVELADEEPQRGRFVTPVARDFFAVPLADKLALLFAVTDGLRAAAGARARSASAHVGARRQDKLLATSDGTSVEQLLVHAGGGMKIVVGEGDEVAHRSYPMELDGGVAAGGWEVIERFDFAGNAPRIADEALALLSAPACPAGATTVILDTPQLALQIHESCGHPTESDRAFGDEVSLAGASFLTPDRLGRFRYGSRHVNLTADATTPGALGTFGWDDEGVPARKTPLVARGQFVGYLTSRETRGAARPAALGRLPARRGVEPLPHHPHDQRVARAGAGRPVAGGARSPTPTTAWSWATTRAGRSTICG